MKTARAVTRLTAGVQGIWPLGDQPGVIGGLEPAVDFLVALFTFFRSDVFGPRHIGQHDDGPVNRLT